MVLRIAIVLILLQTASSRADDADTKRCLVIAHRGVHQDDPENSMAAIKKAVELNCDYVEVDVRTTRDHQLVLMHDGTVDRTTMGEGHVAEMTLAEIRQLRFGPAWPNEIVPTFDEVLSACKGKIKVYIDHKDAAPTDVLLAVEKHQMLADVIVYGSLDTLREYRKLNPQVSIMTPHPGSIEEIKQLVGDLKPQALDGNILEWTVEQVKAAHQAGTQVWVDNPGFYDTEDGVGKAIELGVDAIQSDHPQRLIELLTSHRLR
jgi:glycerophosphoryl diester phosphodiesterase